MTVDLCQIEAGRGKTPPALLKIAQAAAAKHATTEAAFTAAIEKAERHPDYSSWSRQAIGVWVRDLIHDASHAANTRLKRERGEYGAPCQVHATDTHTILTRRFLDEKRIDGKRLGDLFGEELLPLAGEERERARGNILNAMLLETIAPRVNDKQAVREALTDDEAWTIYCGLEEGPTPTGRRGRKDKTTLLATAP